MNCLEMNKKLKLNVMYAVYQNNELFCKQNMKEYPYNSVLSDGDIVTFYKANDAI